VNEQNNILLAFYGDDFTGSTDALEFLSRAGARTVLFTEPPLPEQLNKYAGIKAFGVAGMTRSMAPGTMEKALVPAFQQLKASGARHVHYKVCSTFDSSPSVGSIGKAIDCGLQVFDNTIVPVLGGMPALGRYCVFGNLFARMGIGSNGDIYRLDRHPSMSRHPVTPAQESDLRLHLVAQTDKRIGLIDVLQLDQPVTQWNKAVQDEGIVLIDALYDEHLVKIGEWMDAQYNHTPLFSVGSSGIEMALGNYWSSKQVLKPAMQWADPGKAGPLLVISGSCSPVTAGQIARATANGFEEIELDAVKVSNNDCTSDDIMSRVNELVRQQKNVIVHTGSKQQQHLSPEKLGNALGCIAKQAVKTNPIKRLVIAGGDTSSYAARAMGIEAVEMIAPLVPGAPLCKATAPGSPADRLEINFKGGQVGGDNYFDILLNGKV
jgi:3-oxoisoapionate kinase